MSIIFLIIIAQICDVEVSSFPIKYIIFVVMMLVQTPGHYVVVKTIVRG